MRLTCVTWDRIRGNAGEFVGDIAAAAITIRFGIVEVEDLVRGDRIFVALDFRDDRARAGRDQDLGGADVLPLARRSMRAVRSRARGIW